MNKKEFEKLVIKALEELPQVFKDSLDNVDVVVEDTPSPYESGSAGVSQRRMVLGLYQGVPLSKRCHYYGMVIPDKISIFKDNIERICSSSDEVVRVVAHTVQHEMAHHLGISDDRLRELGIY